MAHAGAVELLALAHRIDDAERSEKKENAGGEIGGGGLPVGEVGEAECEFKEGVEESVGARARGEEIVFCKAAGEGGEIEEFDHREDGEKEAHEVVHPVMPRPAGSCDLKSGGGEGSDEDDDEEGGVGGKRGRCFFGWRGWI